MAGGDELACAASSVSRLMQTSKTAMTNGNAPKHRSNGGNNPETKKMFRKDTDKEMPHTVEGEEGGKEDTAKVKAIFSLRYGCSERHAGRLIS